MLAACAHALGRGCKGTHVCTCVRYTSMETALNLDSKDKTWSRTSATFTLGDVGRAPSFSEPF